MGKKPDPLFLERKSYRRRRLLDAVRMVVFLALLLFMMPLLWPSVDSNGEGAVPMSAALSYVFGVWGGLIILAAGLTFGRRFSPEATEKDGSEQEA